MSISIDNGRKAAILAPAQTLLDQTDRYTRMQLLLTEGQSRAQQEHEGLLAAWRGGKAEEAGSLDGAQGPRRRPEP